MATMKNLLYSRVYDENKYQENYRLNHHDQLQTVLYVLESGIWMRIWVSVEQ